MPISTPLLRAALVAGLATGAGLAAAASPLAASPGYHCYWATLACGTGAIAPNGGYTEANSSASSERPFMNNANVATSNKRIQRHTAAGAWDGGAWNGGPQIWVVQVFNQQNKRWGCYNNPLQPGGTITVNCGHY